MPEIQCYAIVSLSLLLEYSYSYFTEWQFEYNIILWIMVLVQIHTLIDKSILSGLVILLTIVTFNNIMENLAKPCLSNHSVLHSSMLSQ